MSILYKLVKNTIIDDPNAYPAMVKPTQSIDLDVLVERIARRGSTPLFSRWPKASGSSLAGNAELQLGRGTSRILPTYKAPKADTDPLSQTHNRHQPYDTLGRKRLPGKDRPPCRAGARRSQ